VAQVADVTAPTGVAAFDFDGTLVAGDSLPRFLARVLGRRTFTQALVRAGPAMVSAYRRGGRDGSKAAMLERTLSGQPSAYVAEVGTVFGAALAERIRPAMIERMEWHDRQGHRRVLVSASLAVYLEPFGRLTGFHDVIATQLATDGDGRLTGRLHGPNVRAHQKAVRLSELLGPQPGEMWAYGDSAGDREMLAMADHPTRVSRRPRRR
jgi:phosphatidylglycerophosphatase C